MDGLQIGELTGWAAVGGIAVYELFRTARLWLLLRQVPAGTPYVAVSGRQAVAVLVSATSTRRASKS